MTPVVTLEQDSLYVLTDPDDPDGEFEKLCEGIEFLYISNSLDSEICTAVLHVMVPGDPLVRVPLDGLKQVLKYLIPAGLNLPDVPYNNYLINIYLLDLRSQGLVPYRYQYTKLGFKDVDDGNRCFMLDRPLGLPKGHKYEMAEYSGSLDITPKGSFDAWLEMLKAEVEGNVPLTLALAIGVSSILVDMLKGRGLISELPIFAFVGESSTGKSTAQKLIASMYGNPGSLISDLHCTENAFFAGMSAATPLPHIIDEATFESGISMERLTYLLPTGISKRRCDSKGNPIPPAIYSGVFVISSETSLLERTTAKAGQKVRLFELTLPWTKTKANAERISHVVAENYGHAAYKFIRFILNNEDKIVTEYKNEVDNLVKKHPNLDSTTQQRALNMVAVELISAKIVRKCFGITVDLDAIEGILVNLVQNTSVSTIDEIYDSLLEEVLNNIGHFLGDGTDMQLPVPYSLWGIYTKYSYEITKAAMEKMLKKVSVMDLKQTLKDLHKHGYIRKYSDRYLHKYYLKGTPVNCYTVLLPTSKARAVPTEEDLERIGTLLNEDEDDDSES